MRAGVVIASVTELEFNLMGLVSALISTFTLSIQNIYSKKVSRLKLHTTRALTVSCLISLYLTLTHVTLWTCVCICLCLCVWCVCASGVSGVSR